MINYEDYVSFEPAQWAIDYYVDPDLMRLRTRDQKIIEKGLEEISSTPEGLELIKYVASLYEDGKINIMRNKGDLTFALTPNDFALGSEDSSFKYQTEAGTFENISIQRLIYHELQHHFLGHQQITLENEYETTRETNQFMEKYYNAPNRDEKAEDINLSGTKKWDFNKNFNSQLAADEMLRYQVSAIPPDQIENYSPELQSLYEFIGHPERFQEQLRQLESSGQSDDTTKEIGGIIKSDTAPQSVSNTPDQSPKTPQVTNSI